MLNIGLRPTIDGEEKTIEVHILNFDENIYGEEITLTFENRIRDEKKFDSLDALKSQLELDKQFVQAN